jgi:hypothetical protein
MFERLEVHLGQNLLHGIPGDDAWLTREELEPVEILVVRSRTRARGERSR